MTATGSKPETGNDSLSIVTSSVMEIVKQPFSNAQLELLKAFSHNLSESDLIELKQVLAQFFAQRAIKEADRVWDEKGWTAGDMERMLQQKMRTP